MRKKIAITLAAVSAVVGLVAGPAHASRLNSSVVLITFGTGSQDGVHNVLPQCTAGPGASKDLGTITYAVQGSADASSTNGSVGIGTALTCYIKDSVTGATYGSVSRGLPGPHAQAAGTIDVPLSSHPYICATANAVFDDNGTATYNDC